MYWFSSCTPFSGLISSCNPPWGFYTFLIHVIFLWEYEKEIWKVYHVTHQIIAADFSSSLMYIDVKKKQKKDISFRLIRSWGNSSPAGNIIEDFTPRLSHLLLITSVHSQIKERSLNFVSRTKLLTVKCRRKEKESRAYHIEWSSCQGYNRNHFQRSRTDTWIYFNMQSLC